MLIFCWISLCLQRINYFDDHQGQVVFWGQVFSEMIDSLQDGFHYLAGRARGVLADEVVKPLAAEHFFVWILGFKNAVRRNGDDLAGSDGTPVGRVSAAVYYPQRQAAVAAEFIHCICIRIIDNGGLMAGVQPPKLPVLAIEFHQKKRHEPAGILNIDCQLPVDVGDNLLDAAAEQHQERFGRPTSLIDHLVPEAEPEVDMDQVSIWDLLEAFDTICKATGTHAYTGHILDDTPIDLYQIEVLHRLQTEGPLTFERVFDTKPNRIVMVGLFLALLELIRDRLVWAEQGENLSQIYLRALTDEPPEQAVQKAIMAVGEAQSEAARQAEPSHTPPIPIVELPPKARKQVEEQEGIEDMEAIGALEDMEEDATSADDDFVLDEP